MKAIFEREFKSYFTSAAGYLFIGIFLLVIGFNFVTNIWGGTTEVAYLFRNMQWILAVLIPLITMGSFADEKKNKTDQLLLTSPNSITAIVLGKFFGALSYFGVCLATTLLHIGVFYIYGQPNLQLILTAYLAIILLAALYTAIGIFVSSLTENAVVAAVVGVVLLAFLGISGMLLQMLTQPVLQLVLGVLDTTGRYYAFYSSLLSPEPIVYFISLTALFVFLTVRVIEKRRWN